MSATAQHVDDHQMTKILQAAGWTPVQELRPGYPVVTVGMHYQNGDFDVAVSRWESLTPGEFLLEAMQGRLPLGLTADQIAEQGSQPVGQMYIVYQNKLGVVLQAIITFAKQVHAANVSDVIRPLLAVIPRAYTQQSVSGRQGDTELLPSTIDPTTWYQKIRS